MKGVILFIIQLLAFTSAFAQAYPELMDEPAADADIQQKINALRFNDAREAIEAKIKAVKKKKESVAHLEELLACCTVGVNALNGTDRVLIVDSVVIDKVRFLDAYGILPELGTLTMSADGKTVSYKAQLSGMELTPQLQSVDGRQSLVIMRHYSDDDAEPQAVAGLDVDGDVNYPFLLPDGQRFYFAARSDDGYGNYDLYATRYDNDSKRFYRAENMGFPYNSSANDYMLVIDELNGVGWFASDRYQPEGKVCVYTFIPHESRQVFDDSELTEMQLVNAASLHSITALQALYTDAEQAQIVAARNTIASLSIGQQQTRHSEFEFVIDDATTYRSINDFRSTKARQLCKQWQQFVKSYTALESQLDDMRGNPAENAQKIIAHEQRLLELKDDINSLVKKIRAEEKK